jgi:hypothetical protein
VQSLFEGQLDFETLGILRPLSARERLSHANAHRDRRNSVYRFTPTIDFPQLFLFDDP